MHDKAFNIAKYSNYDGYQCGPALTVYNFFIKTSVRAATLVNKSALKNENMSNKQLAEQFHKPIIRKFNKIKVHSPFTNNIWDVDLADMQLITKVHKGFFFSLCVIDIFSK